MGVVRLPSPGLGSGRNRSALVRPIYPLGPRETHPWTSLLEVEGRMRQPGPSVTEGRQPATFRGSARAVTGRSRGPDHVVERSIRVSGRSCRSRPDRWTRWISDRTGRVVRSCRPCWWRSRPVPWSLPVRQRCSAVFPGWPTGVSGGTAALGVAGFGTGPISRLKSFGRSDAVRASVDHALPVRARGPDHDQFLFRWSLWATLWVNMKLPRPRFCSGRQPTTTTWPGSRTRFTGRSRIVSSF